MLRENDPFEKFREQKMAERLTKKVKSAGSVKCPEGEDVKERKSLDASRNWIY